MNKLLFFSGNQGKIKEINKLFSNLSISVYSPKNFNFSSLPKESGSSFAENAKIKSLFGYINLGIPCFADDSGISIEALGWKPNIFSNRFIKKFKNDEECLKYICKEVKSSGKTSAYFKTSICLTLKKNYHIVFEGKIEGKISKELRGMNGFGYDPIFIPDGYFKTFSEIKRNEKNKISHRSIAVNKLINFLSN